MLRQESWRTDGYNAVSEQLHEMAVSATVRTIRKSEINSPLCEISFFVGADEMYTRSLMIIPPLQQQRPQPSDSQRWQSTQNDARSQTCLFQRNLRVAQLLKGWANAIPIDLSPRRELKRSAPPFEQTDMKGPFKDVNLLTDRTRSHAEFICGLGYASSPCYGFERL